MASLVDSSVLIVAERGDLDPASLEGERLDDGLALAAITASELLHGVHRLRASGRKVQAEAFVETVLERLPVVPFDLSCARAHARLGAVLARRGVTIGAHDLFIGATAMAHGFTVLTRDKRSFPKIPDLQVELI